MCPADVYVFARVVHLSVFKFGVQMFLSHAL